MEFLNLFSIFCVYTFGIYILMYVFNVLTQLPIIARLKRENAELQVNLNNAKRDVLKFKERSEDLKRQCIRLEKAIYKKQKQLRRTNKVRHYNY